MVRLSREVKGILKGSAWVDDGSVFYAEKEPPFDGNLVFMEHGIRFGADVIRGQKTGFFVPSCIFLIIRFYIKISIAGCFSRLSHSCRNIHQLTANIVKGKSRGK